MRFDDDQLVAALCDAVLAPTDRAKHQVVTYVCDRCQNAEQLAGGKRFSIGRAALSRVECDAQWIDPETQRAKSEIPSKTRRAVFQRDSNRCRVPGCRSSRHLDVHHIVKRSEGGTHEPENLILLCSGHHRAHHDGQLAISGTASRLVVGDAIRDATLALTTAGYSRREAVAAIEAACAHVGAGNLDMLVREGLRLLA